MYDMGNRDGFGLMFVEPDQKGVDRVVTVKSMLPWKGIMEIYEEHMERDIAVHVRNASMGMPKDMDNCHPFKVLSLDDGDKLDLYMMHNGRFGDIQVDRKYSDSWNFATKFLRGYLKKHPNALQDLDFQYFLAGIIGQNKLVFLDNKRRFTIINSDLGAMHPTGVWVSTKQEIKLYNVPTTTTTPASSQPSQQFGGNPAWSFSKGTWEKDSDHRLHFVHTLVEVPKKESEQAEDTINAQLGELTDNGTPDDDVNEEGLIKILKELKTMTAIDVFNFVVTYHKESLKILTTLTKEDKDKLKLIIANSPWEASEMIIKHSKVNLAKVAVHN